MENLNKKVRLLDQLDDTKNNNTEKMKKKQNKYSINVNNKIQHHITNANFLSNKICTSKYNFINAIPKILCEQFSKVGNIYFLILAILQMIPSVSQSGGSPVMLVPLIFVVLVNGIKDFCEDYKRKQSDGRENKTKSTVIIAGQEGSEIINWEEIRPGNIVKVYKDEYFPVDLVLLYSTNKNGVAYVETKNLDGETNLKYKESVKNTYKLLKNFEQENERENVMKRTFGTIQCDNPNAHMYEYEGVYYYDSRTSVVNFDMNENNEVNEANVKNRMEENFNRTYSQEIITSNNKDASQNQKNIFVYSSEAKLSNSEREKEKDKYFDDEGDKHNLSMNAYLTNSNNNNNNNMITLDYNNFLLRGSSLRNTEYIYGVVIYCGHNTKIMLNSLNARSKQSRMFKIMNSQLKLIISLQLIICISFGILYSLDPDPYINILYFEKITTLDILKNFVLSFLAWLLAISNIVPISLLVTIEMIKFCQASFISWDFKMYDKVNKRTAIVQSSALNEELGQIQDIFTDKTGTLTKNVMQFRYMVIGEFIYGSENQIDGEELKTKKVTNVNFSDQLLFEHWNNARHINSENINNFIFSLAICHSIIVEKKDDEVVYNASSPDELALVNAAKYFGVEFIERTDDNFIIIKNEGNIFRYKLLNIFEFNSNRKRMSVLIRDENNVIKLICKGADNVITKRLNYLKSGQVEKKVMSYLEEFGRKGLRTLMIAEREVSEEEYKIFMKRYYKAVTQTTKDKHEQLDLCYESLEKDLILTGATAIEDCLQDDLKPTLEAFRQIGIKIWMLTGDHPFTAVSIGHSCGLIEKDFEVIIISSTKYEEINKKLFEVIDEEEKGKICLVITGDALALIQRPVGIGLKNLLLMAIEKSECVICSRMTPKQKAELVLLVKRPYMSTLAIGDGANDVNMITSADVGIGIMGNEGQQAARAADYVIAQFSFLRRLMFVHGREAYRKNSFAVGYILWKNVLFVTPCLFLGISSYFSGQTLYDPFLDTLYNILFTAYPIGWFATYDKELNYDKLEFSPKLYEIGMSNTHFNVYIFWRWYLYAATAGLIIYWNNTSVLNFAIQNEESHLLDLWAIGSSMYTCIVFVVNLKIMFATNTHNTFSVFLLIFSISSYLVTLWLSSKIPSMNTLGEWDTIMTSLSYVGAMLHIITACMLCEYGWRSLHYIVEEYIIKTKVAPVSKKRTDSDVHKLSEDSVMLEKGFVVKINPNHSINSRYNSSKANSDLESSREEELNDESNDHASKNSDESNLDQTIILNKDRRCN